MKKLISNAAISAKSKGENITRRIITKAKNGVAHVTPHIHGVKLSLKSNNENTIKKIFNIDSWHKASKLENIKMPAYKKVAYGIFNDTKFRLGFDKNNNVWPDFTIYTTSPSQLTLYLLSKELPQMTLSSVEYALDIFCKDHEAAGKLFYMLRRFMYFPYSGRTTCVGGRFDGIAIDRDENCVWGIYNKSGKNKRFNIYERGDDKSKDGKGWKSANIDRVRIEYFAKNKGKHFAIHGISNLGNFVKNSKFYDIVSSKFMFYTFKNNNIKLPSFGDDYNAPDKSGNIECFQEEFIMGKNLYKNMSQFLEKISSLEKFHKMLTDAMLEHERTWKENYNKLSRKYS